MLSCAITSFDVGIQNLYIVGHLKMENNLRKVKASFIRHTARNK